MSDEPFFLNKKVAKLCQCREGLHALPKTMFDLFSSNGWSICQRLMAFSPDFITSLVG
jgi:hypothetical protein